MTHPIIVWIALPILLVPEAAPAATPTKATASVAVKGHVGIRLEVVGVDITVRNGAKDKVTVSAERCDQDGVELDLNGDRLEIEIAEFTSCHGPLTIDAPAGTDLALESVDGDLLATGSYGEARLASVNGSIRVDGARRAEIESVNGAVECRKASDVEIQNVSGTVVLETAGTAPRVAAETVSGGLDWSGACGKDCRLELQTLSGRLRLRFDERASDFELRFQSKTGALDDGLKLAITKRVKNVMGGVLVRGRYKGGAGSVDIDSFSGGVELRKR